MILAGDIHPGLKGIEWALQTIKKPVIYVLGNHEYYRESYPKLLAKLREATRGTHVHILENDRLDLGDTIFLGCTLWTDFSLFGNPKVSGYQCSLMMNDYKKIRRSPGFGGDSYAKLRSLDTAFIHAKSRHWLECQLAEPQRKKTVVVTHHAPSPRSLPLRKRHDMISAAYVSILDELIQRHEINLWVHGHIHYSSDYEISGTRVICNPKGYPMELNPKFSGDLIVEV